MLAVTVTGSMGATVEAAAGVPAVPAAAILLLAAAAEEEAAITVMVVAAVVAVVATASCRCRRRPRLERATRL
jgi:hypothetical protein